MELIPNSRFITIINNIDSSIVDRIELTDTFYVNLNLFLDKYSGPNEDYVKLICNNILINSINIFKVDEDFAMPDDTDIIYMVKSHKKYVYIKKVNEEYILIRDEEFCYDKYYYILYYFPDIPRIISYNDIMHNDRKELIILLLHNCNYTNYNNTMIKYISGMIYSHEYDDYDFMLNIFSHCVKINNIYSLISDRLKNNKKFILELVSLNPFILEYVTSDMKNNYDVVLAAVTSNIGDGYILKYASDNMRNNYDIVLAAVNNNGNALLFANDNLQDNYDIVLDAIKKDNYDIILAAVTKINALQYASNNLKDNYDIILAAVNNNGHALQYASEKLKDNYDIVLAAVNQNHSSIQYASDRLKKIIKT